MNKEDVLNKATTLIKEFEGCRLNAYIDQAGVVTIGWGSTGPDVQLGCEWSQQQADERLKVDVEGFLKRVEELVKVPLTDNQWAALVSFTYNLGPQNLARSGLLKLLNKSQFAEAANQFLLWDKIGAYTSPGLARRRAAERALFLTA